MDFWITLDYSLILIITCSGFDLETLGPPEWDIHEQGRVPDGLGTY